MVYLFGISDNLPCKHCICVFWMSYVHIKISERLLPRLPDKGYARKWVVNGQQNKLKHVLTTKTGNITNQKGYAFNVLAIEE